VCTGNSLFIPKGEIGRSAVAHHKLKIKESQKAHNLKKIQKTSMITLTDLEISCVLFR
jgi:hypothetical protein